jgi:DNA-binding response OmpR family regulator
MSDRPIVVLNVNDDAATRYLMTRILRSGGYTVYEAADGESALREVAARRPELVLLDVKLPDISGLEVCRRIKSDPATASVLVVQTSATFASSDRKVAGLDSGADSYLAQPIEPVELLASARRDGACTAPSTPSRTRCCWSTPGATSRSATAPPRAWPTWPWAS